MIIIEIILGVLALGWVATIYSAVLTINFTQKLTNKILSKLDTRKVGK